MSVTLISKPSALFNHIASARKTLVVYHCPAVEYGGGHMGPRGDDFVDKMQELVEQYPDVQLAAADMTDMAWSEYDDNSAWRTYVRMGLDPVKAPLLKSYVNGSEEALRDDSWNYLTGGDDWEHDFAKYERLEKLEDIVKKLSEL